MNEGKEKDEHQGGEYLNIKTAKDSIARPSP